MSHLGFRLVMDDARWAEVRKQPAVAMAAGGQQNVQK
jgi:hypothetical protein